MTVTNTFKNVPEDGKLALYYKLIIALSKGEKRDESTVCTPISRQERQPVNRRTNLTMQTSIKG